VKREKKQEKVEELIREFKEAQNAFLIDYRGINAAEATQLRAKIRKISSHYRVVKNTLALRAIDDSPLSELKVHFQGPVAIAYNRDNPVALAKLLVDFSKEKEIFNFKAGVMEGKPIDVALIKEIASLPSKEELISKFVFILKMPLIRLVTALGSPLINFISVLKEVEKTKSS